jgi:hypothetical protein
VHSTASHRRQLRPHVGIDREIKRGLAVRVFQAAVGAALEKKIDRRGIAQRNGDHERGPPAAGRRLGLGVKAAGYPGGKHFKVIAVERHHVGAKSWGELAKHVTTPEKFRRIGRRKA